MSAQPQKITKTENINLPVEVKGEMKAKLRSNAST